MPKLTISCELPPELIVDEVKDRLLGRRPQIEKDLAVRLAAEMARTGAIKFEYRKDPFHEHTTLVASVIVGEEHVYTHKMAEPEWQP